MGSLFHSMFQPLYGPEKPSRPVRTRPPSKAAPAPKAAPKAAPKTPLVMGPYAPKSIAPRAPTNNGLAGFVKDNKTLLLIAMFIIILVVVGYLAYRQKKQTRAILRLAKKFKRLK